jgi:hypothetical protein
MRAMFSSVWMVAPCSSAQIHKSEFYMSLMSRADQQPLLVDASSCTQPLRQYMCPLQDAGVRQAAATALLTLYNADDNVSPLHAFTARFSTRFAELVYDVDEGVAVKGVRQSHAHALQRLSSPVMLTHNDLAAVRHNLHLPLVPPGGHDHPNHVAEGISWSIHHACLLWTMFSRCVPVIYSMLCVCRSS